MAISNLLTKNLMTAVADQTLGNLAADAVNLAALSSHVIADVIVATNVSTTLDFAGKLAVGDRVVVVPAAAPAQPPHAHFLLVATAGTLPEAAVVGSLYIVIRAKEAASAVKF